MEETRAGDRLVERPSLLRSMRRSSETVLGFLQCILGPGNNIRNFQSLGHIFHDNHCVHLIIKWNLGFSLYSKFGPSEGHIMLQLTAK